MDQELIALLEAALNTRAVAEEMKKDAEKACRLQNKAVEEAHAALGALLTTMEEKGIKQDHLEHGGRFYRASRCASYDSLYEINVLREKT